MHILMLLERDYPPDLRVEKEIKSLTEAGHKITLACFTFRKKLEIEEKGRFSIFRFPITKFTFKSSVAALKFPGYFSFWRKNLKQLFHKETFDAIHVHDLPLARIGMEFKTKYNIPLILDLHENWPALLQVSEHTNTFLGKLLSSHKQWEKYEKDAIRQADKIIVVVQEAKERVLKLGIKDEKVVIVSNTIDDTEISISAVPLNSRFTMIYAGGLNKHRGLQIALDAVKQVVINIPDLNFLIIGEGRFKKVLEQKIQDLNLENNVVFTGWISFNTMLHFLAESHIALIPHLKNAHTDTTIPHKLFQYFTAGKPVIASDCEPLKRIILETETGLVYKNDNPNELTDAILTLFEDHGLYTRIQINQKKALKNDSWSRDAKRLVELYRDISK